MAASVDSSRYSDLCRLCAAKTNIVLGINIFENEGSIRQVRRKIECCLPLQVHQTDDLPKMICESCLYKLDMLFDFRERSIRTEKLLQDLVKEFDNERTQEDETLNVMAMDHNGMIIVPPHHLLEGHMQNVGIDLAHLSQRNDMIVGHGLLLAQTHQPNVNIDLNDDSLANLEMNHHDLSHDNISSHGLHTPDAMLLNSTPHQNLSNTQFTGSDIDMIHHQHNILQEQFGIRPELEIESIALNNVPQADVSLIQQTHNIHQNTRFQEKDENFNENKKIMSRLSYPQDQRIIPNEHCNVQNSPGDSNIKLELLSHHEDSNSTDNKLHIDEGELSRDIGKVYLLHEHSEVLDRITSDSTECTFCNVCGSSFTSKETFEEHYSTHFTKCQYCFVACASEEVLDAHLKEAHGNISTVKNETVLPEPKPVKTRLKRATKSVRDTSTSSDGECQSEVDLGVMNGVQKLVESEIVTAESNTNNQRKKWSPKVCTECGNSYKTNYKLTEHMRKHTGEKPYKCGSCEKSFRSKIGLAQHEAKHTGQYDLSCPTCGKGFQCRSYLMVHQRVHSDVKPWPCSTCGVNFKTKQALLDHTNRHLGVKPYMCDECGRRFITKGLCKMHQKIHNGLDNRKYSCKICNKMFVSKSYLQTHLKIHTGEKPFTCEVCGKGFLTRVDLRIHSTLHTGEKSYVCEICGKAFARRDALRCHRRSHTGERPYSCEICGQTFTQFTPMVIHKRLHTGERPYSCEVCLKTFVSKSTMMAHAKKHVT